MDDPLLEVPTGMTTDSFSFESEFGKHHHNEVNVESIWVRLLPFEFTILMKYWVSSSPAVKIAWRRFMYILAGVLLGYSAIALFLLHIKAIGSDTDLEYKIIFSIQALFYVGMPFISMDLLDEVLTSDDVPVLFSEAMRFDPMFKRKFLILTHLNFFLVFLSLVAYCLFSEFNPAAITSSIFFTVLFYTPFVFAYCLSFILLEGFRLQALKFISDVKAQRKYSLLNKSLGSLALADVRDVELVVRLTGEELPAAQEAGMWSEVDLISRYYMLHARCIYTSEKRGKKILFLFLYSIISSIGSSYGVLTQQYELLSVFLFTLVAVLVMLQIGISVATVNEMGTLVCRELSTSQLCILHHERLDGASSSRNYAAIITQFYNCIVYSKFEIYFFGNFALRSSTLIAVLGSVLAAMLPSIISRSN